MEPGTEGRESRLLFKGPDQHETAFFCCRAAEPDLGGEGLRDGMRQRKGTSPVHGQERDDLFIMLRIP